MRSMRCVKVSLHSKQKTFERTHKQLHIHTQTSVLNQPPVGGSWYWILFFYLPWTYNYACRAAFFYACTGRSTGTLGQCCRMFWRCDVRGYIVTLGSAGWRYKLYLLHHYVTSHRHSTWRFYHFVLGSRHFLPYFKAEIVKNATICIQQF